MSCVRKSNTNEESSILFKDLLKIADNNEQKADKLLAYFRTPEFLELFGDYISFHEKDNKTLEEVREFVDRVDENNEPKLFFSRKLNRYYYRDKYNEPIFYPHSEQGIRSVFDTNSVKTFAKIAASSFYISNIEFNYETLEFTKSSNKLLREFLEDFIADKSSELLNSEDPDMFSKGLGLQETLPFINEWVNEIKDYFSSLKINYKEEDADEDENGPREGENLVPDELMRQESFLKGTKNNVNNNIKLFLSLITTNKVNDFNEYEFVEFDDIYNTLNKALSNQIALDTEDIFDIYLNTIHKLINVKPYFSKLYNLLSTGRISNDDSFKNQFVAAFNLYKNNYLGTETSVSKDGKRNVSIKNLSEVGSRKGSILSIWEFNFLNKKFTNTGIKNINDTVHTKLNKFQSNLKYINTELDLLPHLTDIKEILNKLGVEFTEKGFEYYLNNLSYSDISLKDKIKKLRKTFTDITFSLNNYLENSENIFTNQNIFREIAESEAFFMSEGSDASVFTTGKTKWVYSLPSYIDLKIQKWKKDPNTLYKHYNSTEYTKGSDWMHYLSAADIVDKQERLKVSKERLSEVEMNIFNSIQLEGDSTNAVDNKEISYTDALNDYIHKLLNSRKGGKTFHKTALAADKATERQIHFGSDSKMIFNKYANTRIQDGKVIVDANIVEVFYNYFKSDYNRMIKEYDFIQKGKNLLPHYHTNGKNALKSQLFPSLSLEINRSGKIIPPNLDIQDKDGNDIHLYDKDGKPVYSNLDIIKEEISDLIHKALSKGISKTFNTLFENNVFVLDENGNRINNTIDSNIYKWYVDKAGLNNESLGKKNAPLRIAGDLFINSTISQVEYSKMFTGDVAYYKNTTDYKKRVPATYTDGVYMRLNPRKDEKIFNASIIAGVEISAQDLDKMKEYLPDNIIDKYSNNSINSTDAQAWITPERWKFILERLGKWNQKREVIYKKMQEDTPRFDPDELKLVAQPLKGVYFDVNEKGIPTFLKYSQAVLVPNLIKDTGLEKLFDKMTKDNKGKTLPYEKQIHELITQDGIKVGSPIPVVTHDINGDVLDDFELEILPLNNSAWKLQQDLPTKGIKPTDVGSQIQKNIFQGLAFNLEETFELGGYEVKGDKLIDYINTIVGALSSKGKQSIINRLGIDPDTLKITNEEALYSSLIDQLKTRKDTPANFIKALEAGLSPYGIPGAFQMFQNVFSSIVNKELVKIQTNGGGFIQMADYGLSKTEAVSKNMIFTPWFNENKLGTYRKVDGKRSLNPAGIFLSGSMIAKHIPNYKELKSEELFGVLNEETGKYEGGKIDQEILQNIIGYRIPNQGLPSNDALSVMGILPEEMGDTVIAYTGITTKTGSDFDIDKMYLMIPSFNAIYPKKGVEFAEKYIKDAKITYNTIKNEVFKLGENVDILDRDQVYDIFISSILLDNENLDNNFYTDFNKEFLQSKLVADKLVYTKLALDEEGKPYPLYQQSKKALQNRLIEAYKSVLTNEKVLPDVMNPIDLDIIEKDIKNMFPDVPETDLMSFDAISDLQLKNEFRLGKAGLGQNVNSLVDSVRGSMANLYFDEYLGWGNNNGEGTKFDEEWSEDLTKDKFKSTKEVLDNYISEYNKNSKGKPITLKDIKRIKLSTSMMMLVNGFVDIAKDPYIVKGNWVTQTNDLGFMLIRAGVHPFKVNAFLAQPILKDYVKFVTNQESKSINDTGRLSEKFKLKRAADSFGNDKVTINDITVSKKKLFNKFININQIRNIGEFPLEDSSVENITKYSNAKTSLFHSVSRKFMRSFGTNLKELKENKEMVKQFAALKEEFVKAYEDVFEVKPKDFSTISLKDLKDQIKEDGSDISIQLAVMDKFETWMKFSKRLAANVSASKIDVEGKGKNINSLIIAVNKINNILENEINVGSLKGYKSKLTHNGIDTHQNIVIKNGLTFPYEVMKANPKYFFSANDNTIFTFNSISKGLYGQRLQNSDLADKLEKSYYSYILSGFSALQTTREEKEDLINNFPGEFNKIKKELPSNILLNELTVKANNDTGYNFVSMPSMKKSVSFQNALTDSWSDLLGTHPEFAEKLIKYSFLISGFNNSINQFHKYIPYMWFNKNRFNSYLKELTSDFSNGVDVNFIDQFHRNNHHDNATTIRVFTGAMNELAPGDNYNTGYYLELKKNTKVPYLTKNIIEQEMQDPYEITYKYVGTYQNRAYYLVSSLLGYKDSKGNKVIEYSIGQEKDSNFISMFKDNKVDPRTFNSSLYLDILNNPTITREYDNSMQADTASDYNAINENLNTSEVINNTPENLDMSEKNTTFVEESLIQPLNDRVDIKYPETINGLNTLKLMELTKVPFDKAITNPDKDSFSYAEIIEEKVSSAAADYVSDTNSELSESEAAFFRANNEFMELYLDNYLNTDNKLASGETLQSYAQKVLDNSDKKYIDRNQLDLFDFNKDC